MSETIGVGVIGFGLAGRAFHTQVIRAVPGLRLAAILQRKGSEAAEAYPESRIARSLDELLSIKEVRLVVVATSNESHFPLAKACLEAGRDVLVDKPFTTTLQEAEELARLAAKTGRVLTVYQNRRYDGDFQAIQRLAQSGALGRLVRFESHYDRYRPKLKAGAWREKPGPGTGILFDIAPHLIDHAVQLLGLPEAVTADVRREREEAAVDDSFDIMLHYSGGTRAALRSSILAVTPRARFVLLGTKGTFVKQSFDPTENNLRFGKIPASGSWGAEPEKDWGVLTTANEDSTTAERRIAPLDCDYRDFYANLRDTILGLAQPAVPPGYAVDMMRILLLAKASSEQRRTLPWAGAAEASRA